MMYSGHCPLCPLPPQGQSHKALSVAGKGTGWTSVWTRTATEQPWRSRADAPELWDGVREDRRRSAPDANTPSSAGWTRTPCHLQNQRKTCFTTVLVLTLFIFFHGLMFFPGHIWLYIFFTYFFLCMLGLRTVWYMFRGGTHMVPHDTILISNTVHNNNITIQRFCRHSSYLD